MPQLIVDWIFFHVSGRAAMNRFVNPLRRHFCFYIQSLSIVDTMNFNQFFHFHKVSVSAFFVSSSSLLYVCVCKCTLTEYIRLFIIDHCLTSKQLLCLMDLYAEGWNLWTFSDCGAFWRATFWIYLLPWFIVDLLDKIKPH